MGVNVGLSSALLYTEPPIVDSLTAVRTRQECIYVDALARSSPETRGIRGECTDPIGKLKLYSSCTVALVRTTFVLRLEFLSSWHQRCTAQM